MSLQTHSRQQIEQYVEVHGEEIQRAFFTCGLSLSSIQVRVFPRMTANAFLLMLCTHLGVTFHWLWELREFEEPVPCLWAICRVLLD